MDFLYKRHPKGTYEYVAYKKKIDAIVMIILFALALGLFVIGLIATGSKKNLLTIVAVLGLLPACKQVVALIMSLRVKSCMNSVKEMIDEHIGKLYGVYSPYFTAYDKNYAFDHLVITNNSVLLLNTGKSIDEKAYIAHINDLLRKEGLKDILIKVFYDADKYCNRLDELNNMTDALEVNGAVAKLIYNVTL
ncbi:MAG: hypothetical protein KBT19_01245 [Lachnospiraceae bacterium]|nr:hypothetical protein [Candidatus Colinaster equi]